MICDFLDIWVPLATIKGTFEVLLRDCREAPFRNSDMSYCLNSLKGGYIGDYIGDYYRGY